MATAQERWKQAREAAGLSVIEAAQLADASRNTIYDLEKGDDGVTLRMMNRVASVYGVTLGAIFCEEPTAQRVPHEIRPLADLLAPLDADTREKFIRNVVTNARFMGQLLRDVDNSARMDEVRYNSGLQNSANDELRDLQAYSSGDRNAPTGPSGAAAPARVSRKPKSRPTD